MRPAGRACWPVQLALKANFGEPPGAQRVSAGLGARLLGAPVAQRDGPARVGRQLVLDYQLPHARPPRSRPLAFNWRPAGRRVGALGARPEPVRRRRRPRASEKLDQEAPLLFGADPLASLRLQDGDRGRRLAPAPPQLAGLWPPLPVAAVTWRQPASALPGARPPTADDDLFARFGQLMHQAATKNAVQRYAALPYERHLASAQVYTGGIVVGAKNCRERQLAILIRPVSHRQIFVVSGAELGGPWRLNGHVGPLLVVGGGAAAGHQHWRASGALIG